jgi:hypothetical protein
MLNIQNEQKNDEIGMVREKEKRQNGKDVDDQIKNEEEKVKKKYKEGP